MRVMVIAAEEPIKIGGKRKPEEFRNPPGERDVPTSCSASPIVNEAIKVRLEILDPVPSELLVLVVPVLPRIATVPLSNIPNRNGEGLVELFGLKSYVILYNPVVGQLRVLPPVRVQLEANNTVKLFIILIVFVLRN